MGLFTLSNQGGGKPIPFEVDINGTIVHSKLNGDGHVDSPDKMEKILAAIAAAE